DHRGGQVGHLLQATPPVRGDRGVAGGRHDALVGCQQIVGVRVEVGDSADHRGTGDEVVAVGDELSHQLDVARVTLDEPVVRLAVVGVAAGAVLGVVAHAHHLVAALQQLLYDVAADEARRAGDQDFCHASFSSRCSSAGAGIGTTFGTDCL